MAVLQSAARARTGSYLTPAQVKQTPLADAGTRVLDPKIPITKPRVDLGRAVDTLSQPRAPGTFLLLLGP